MHEHDIGFISVIGLPILAVGVLLFGAVWLYLRRRQRQRLHYELTDGDLQGKSHFFAQTQIFYGN